MQKIAFVLSTIATAMYTVRKYTRRPDSILGKVLWQVALLLMCVSFYAPLLNVLLYFVRWALLVGGVYLMTLNSLFTLYPETKKQIPVFLRFLALRVRLRVCVCVTLQRIHLFLGFTSFPVCQHLPHATYSHLRMYTMHQTGTLYTNLHTIYAHYTHVYLHYTQHYTTHTHTHTRSFSLSLSPLLTNLRTMLSSRMHHAPLGQGGRTGVL
jgi:hypothetical protein